MTTFLRSFPPRGGWIGCGVLVVLSFTLWPQAGLAQAASNDTEVAPGLAEQQESFDAHAADMPPPRAPRPARTPRPPITFEVRRFRLGMGYTFMGIGALVLLMGPTIGRHGTSYPWVTQIVSGSVGACMLLVIGLPVVISGYARPYRRSQVAFRFGPTHLQLSGTF